MSSADWEGTSEHGVSMCVVPPESKSCCAVPSSALDPVSSDMGTKWPCSRVQL